ncbi:MAG: hypothetical protein QOC94_3479 [Actinoplanes sp.]|nr:hypothetical protein [Actinoplanes sp.]
MALLLTGAEIAIYFSHPPLTFHRQWAAVELWQYVTQGSSLVIAGLLVLARRVAPAVGWLLLGPSALFMVAACLSTWLRFATSATPGVYIAVYAEYVCWEAPRIALVVLPLCFPHGRFPTGWTRRLAVLITVTVLVCEVNNLLAQRVWHPGVVTMANALFIPAWAPYGQPINQALRLVVAGLALVAAFAPLTYWQRATEVQRRQVTVVVPIFLLLVTEEVVRALWAWSLWVSAARVVLGVLGPAALAYVIVRDRLYDLDRGARRVIGVAVPLVLLAAVYAAAAAAMSALLPGVGAAVPAILAVLAALVGLVLRPASRWVLRRVDQVLYGDRAEPYQLARRLADRLREVAEAAQVPLAVCQIVVSALRLPGAALTGVTPTGPRRLATVGDVDDVERIELRHQGQVVGHLLVAPRSGESALDELDRGALQPLADLAAPAVSAILLAAELESSRARVVSAREDERSRLRRDVHDGVGPSLAAIRLQVDTAYALLPADSPSGSLLGRVSAELGEALAEFRRVTESLRPPVLDQRGLGGALAELAGRLSTVALPVGLDLSGALPALAPAVELAAYRITAEAVTNAIRHARASRVLVTVSAPGEELILRVRDDGVGLRQGRVHGVGLTSMAQRAADLGGTCTLDGRPDGTTVTARLPVGAVDPAMIGL